MNKKAIFYVILAGLLWGTSSIFVRLLTPFGFTSYQMTAIRAVISLLFAAVYSFIKDKTLFRISPKQIPLLLGVGALMFFTASFYYMSIQLTSASTAVVLMYTAPVYVMIYSVLFLGEKMTAQKAVAVGLMLLGCVFVAGLIGGFKFDLMGILFGVLSGITYAAQSILSKLLMNTRTAPASITLYSFAFMALVSLVTLQPTKLVESISYSPIETIPLLIGLGIFTFAAPYFIYNFALRDLSAGTASALCVIEPMASTVYSVLFFKDGLDIFSVLGLIMIVAAVVMISKSESSPEKTDDKTNEGESHADNI